MQNTQEYIDTKICLLSFCQHSRDAHSEMNFPAHLHHNGHLVAIIRSAQHSLLDCVNSNEDCQ